MLSDGQVPDAAIIATLQAVSSSKYVNAVPLP